MLSTLLLRPRLLVRIHVRSVAGQWCCKMLNISLHADPKYLWPKRSCQYTLRPMAACGMLHRSERAYREWRAFGLTKMESCYDQ